MHWNGDGQQSKKVWEQSLMDAFLGDLGSDGHGWTCVDSAREKPDFIYERAGLRVGVEITELLTCESGRERAGERNVAEIIREVVAQVVEEYGGRGAVVDAHLATLPRQRRDASEVGRQFEDHLRREGAPLARDRGVVTAPFRFKWGTVSRIHRQDDLRTIILLRDQRAHRTALTDRDPAWVEDRLIETVKGKVRKAQEYDLTHPLWLVVRNPYTHIAVVPEAAQRELCAANAGLFERVYCHNRKMNTLDASPPMPLVLRVF